MTIIFAEYQEIDVPIDAELLQAMSEERDMLGDSSLEVTITRRLTQGVELADIAGPELLWRPVHQVSVPVAVTLSADTITQIDALAERLGFGTQVLLCTILYNDACKPWEVREAEANAPFAPLRWEPGKGKIYSLRVELPGYQIVFLRMLAGSYAKRDVMLSEAILALARQITKTGVVAGIPVEGEALEFAGKMVRTADHSRKSET